MTIHRFATSIEVAANAAESFAQLAVRCIADRGVFRVALAGGSTPKKMYEMLREVTLDWSKVEFYWSDERFVSPNDAQSNEGMAKAALLDHIRGYCAFGMVTDENPQICASDYAVQLNEPMDLLLLGLGTDGHTASLFPGDPSIHATESVVVSNAPVNAPIRITMTPAYMNRARAVWFLVTGSDKTAPLSRLIDGAEDWNLTPAQSVFRHANAVELFADFAALPTTK